MNDFDALNNECQDEMKRLLDESLLVILNILSKPNAPDEYEISEKLREDPVFQKVYTFISDLRELSAALNKGDLQKFVYSKGYVLSNLKALQSNLRHLTWQTKKVAEGDFSQKVDFLGDFSESFNIMTEKLRDSSAQLVKMASLDGLTQIPNRLTLERFLADTFEKTSKQSGDFSVLMIDIDHFKAVNDTYGHAAGDKILMAISKILSSQFRKTDIFARYGGEEFVAGLPFMSVDEAMKIALRVLNAAQKAKIRIDEKTEITVTVSIGLSEKRPGDQNYTEIIKRSDKALYEAKNTGRNRICVC